MYTEYGRRMSDKVWNETMKQFRFAVADEALGVLTHLQ